MDEHGVPGIVKGLEINRTKVESQKKDGWEIERGDKWGSAARRKME